jgi:hypothetical protein
MKPISLFGTGIKSYSESVTAQRRLNCFYDIRQDGDRSTIIIRGTPGTSKFVTLPDRPIRGWRQIGALLYVAAGASVFQVDGGGTITLLGTISNSGQPVSMSDDSFTLVMVDGVQGYYLVLPSGTPQLISDSSFPNGCTTVTNLDSRYIVEVPNTRAFQTSAQLDGSTWSPIISGFKEGSSDLLSAVDVLNGSLLLFGSQNMEFWQDNGTSPNQFGRITGTNQTWGLAAKFSRAALNNTMVFLGQNPQGGVQVLQIVGYTPTRISNSDIENIISGFRIYGDAVGLTYMLDGHPMYQLTFSNANRSFLYDSSTGFWSETQTGVATTGRHFAQLGIVFNSKNYVSDVSTGIIYQLDANVFTDSGISIKRQVTSRHVRQAGNDFSISEIILEMETGVGVVVGQGSLPQMMMQISRDGGRTFGPERWKSIGRLGHYKRKVLWDRCGSARDFVFQFTMTDPVKFVITQGEAVQFAGTESAQ